MSTSKLGRLSHITTKRLTEAIVHEVYDKRSKEALGTVYQNPQGEWVFRSDDMQPELGPAQLDDIIKFIVNLTVKDR